MYKVISFRGTDLEKSLELNINNSFYHLLLPVERLEDFNVQIILGINTPGFRDVEYI